MHAVQQMVYVGETPWHKLGTRFVGNENFDEWVVAAGFGWDAQTKPLFFNADHATLPGTTVPVALKSHKLLVRSDTQLELGVVGKDYKVVQPKQVMEFFRDIAFSSNSRYKMETAGCLFDGKRVWALARTQNEIRIQGQDVILPYLLLGTGFDGSISTFASYTSVRVVCHNTLSMAIGTNGLKADIRIPHSSTFDENSIKSALGLIEGAEEAAMKNFEETANTLAGRKVDDRDMFSFFAKLYGPKPKEGQSYKDVTVGEYTDGQKANINELIQLFKSGPGATFRSSESTAWGLVNAVTHYEDRKRDNVRGLASSQFGAGLKRKKEAVNDALALAA